MGDMLLCQICLHDSCRMGRCIVMMKLISSLGHCECNGHTVHKLSQWRLTTDWLAPQESDYSWMHSKVSSDLVPSYIKATRPILEVFKMARYFLDNPRSLVSPGNIFYAEEIQCCYGKHICMSSLEEANFGTYLVSNSDHILITPIQKIHFSIPPPFMWLSNKNFLCVSCFPHAFYKSPCLSLQLHTFQHSTCQNIQTFGHFKHAWLICYDNLACVQVCTIMIP